MSICILKHNGIEPMLIADLGSREREGIYKEVHECNIPKKYRIEKLGGSAVFNSKYMRSNTAGLTHGKYFEKICGPLDFQPIHLEEFELLNDNSKKFDIVNVLSVLTNTDTADSLYSINIIKESSDKFYLEVIRQLSDEEIQVTRHEYKEYEFNFKGMYKFIIKITLGSLNLDKAKEIDKIKDKITLTQLKSLIDKYSLNIVNEDDGYIRTHYIKTRTNFDGRRSVGIEAYKKDLSEIMTFTEAAAKWNIDSSTLRKLVTTDKLKENIDYRKSGKVWLITKNAMERIYGIIEN